MNRPAAAAPPLLPTVVVDLPLRLVNGLNVRENPFVRARRAKDQRMVTGMACFGLLRAFRAALSRHTEGLDVLVLITRAGPRRMDDDGLSASAKHVRDGVADALGVDDADPRVQWRYAQQKAQRYAVRIEIEEVPF